MDNILAINQVKTEFREAFNASDVERLLGVFSPAVSNWCEGSPSYDPPEGIASLRIALTRFFQEYQAEVVPIIIDIQVHGDTAYDFGWHKIWLTPRSGGPRTMVKERYFELWRKNDSGDWKIELIMTNRDAKPKMLTEPGVAESLIYSSIQPIS